MGFSQRFSVLYFNFQVSIQHVSHDWSIPGNNIRHILQFFFIYLNFAIYITGLGFTKSM